MLLVVGHQVCWCTLTSFAAVREPQRAAGVLDPVAYSLFALCLHLHVCSLLIHQRCADSLITTITKA